MENTWLYKGLTVGQYQEIQAIDKELSSFEQLVYLVSIIHHCTFDDALKMKRSQFDATISDYENGNFMLWQKERICKELILNGIKYDVQPEPSKLTAGQLLDNINLLKNAGEDPVHIFHLRFATILNPKGKRYGEDNLSLAKRAEMIREVPMYLLYSTYVFFFNKWNFYYPNTEDYLSSQMDKLLKLSKEILTENGHSSQS